MSELKPKDKSTQVFSANTLEKVLRNEVQKREEKRKNWFTTFPRQHLNQLIKQ